MGFLEVWVGYAIFGVTVFSAAFVWAVRAGQFSKLDRGNGIPINAVEPIEDDGEGRVPAKIDRYTGVFLFVVLAALIAMMLKLAAGGGWRLWN